VHKRFVSGHAFRYAEKAALRERLKALRPVKKGFASRQWFSSRTPVRSLSVFPHAGVLWRDFRKRSRACSTAALFYRRLSLRP